MTNEPPHPAGRPRRCVAHPATVSSFSWVRRSGALVALVLSYSFQPSESDATGVVYSQAQVFGFTLLYAVPIGMVLTGLIALLFDRLLARRARTVEIERERIIEAEDDASN